MMADLPWYKFSSEWFLAAIVHIAGALAIFALLFIGLFGVHSHEVLGALFEVLKKARARRKAAKVKS